MRYITAFKVAALALGLGGVAITCQAQAPGGSYQQTCRDIGVRGSTLSATCKDEGGNWRSTQLSDFQRCNGEIQNLNGNLSCTGGNGAGNNGNYNNGNNGDRRDGDNRDANSRDANHSGDRDHDQNGNYRNESNGPRGSYSQTCQNIQVNGDTLQASCQKKNGKAKNSTLRNYQQCRDIQNDNGKLRCSR
ncbi:MAG TPA: CVNH domain-containing protein [Candidatus Angelobacter sp.]